MRHFTSQQLLEEAKTRKLSPEERQIALAYVMQVDPSLSNYDLGNQFGVSEATIRRDKTEIRQTLADELRSTDVGLVVVDAFLCVARQVKDLERSKKELEDKKRLGTREYMLHCRTLVEIQLKFIETQQELGYLPKNIGQNAANKFEYAAVLQEDGSVESRPVDMFDEKQRAKIADIKRKELRAATLPEPSEVIEDSPSSFECSLEQPGQEEPEEAR